MTYPCMETGDEPLVQQTQTFSVLPAVYTLVTLYNGDTTKLNSEYIGTYYISLV